MDSGSNVVHTGNQPARRPPDDEPERVGEGELDIGPPTDLASVSEKESFQKNGKTLGNDVSEKKSDRDAEKTGAQRIKPSEDVVSD